MAKILLNGSEPTDIKLNGTTPDKIMLNGVTYWEKPEPVYLYKWDFTKATDPLVDEINGQTITLKNSITVDSNGMHFNASRQVAYLGEIDLIGKTIVIDVASFDFQPTVSDSTKSIFLANTRMATTGSSATSLIYYCNNKWRCNEYNVDCDSSRSTQELQENTVSSSVYSNDLGINAFNNKRVKLVCGSDRKTLRLYLDDLFIGEIDELYYGASNHLQIGGHKQNPTEKTGCQCYNMTITGVRIYENEA